MNTLNLIIAWFIGLFRKSKPAPTVPDFVPPEVTPPPPAPLTIEQLVKLNDPKEWETLARKIAVEEGMNPAMADALVATIHCESSLNNELEHQNKDGKGNVSSTDYYLCQINDYWHIGAGHDFPSVQYVHDNPDQVIRWMCRMFRAGKANLWVCYKQGLYKKYL